MPPSRGPRNRSHSGVIDSSHSRSGSGSNDARPWTSTKPGLVGQAVLAGVVGDRDAGVAADAVELLPQPERGRERHRARLAVANAERRHRRDDDALGRRQVGEAGGQVAREDLVDFIWPVRSRRNLEPSTAPIRQNATHGCDEKAKRQAKRAKTLHDTMSGHPIKPLYTQEDLEGWDPERDLGKPGEFPYTRGVYESMYRGRLWTMRQFAGFGTVEETNARFRYLLDHGQTGLSTAFDMPSLMGLDSDHARSLGEVGVEGVAVDTVDDMETLFDGIPLDEVTVSMTINAPAAIMLAFYVVAAEEKGISPDKLGGTIQTDILKEYIAQKEWCFPIEPAMRLVTDMVEWCSAEMPRWHPDLDLGLPHPRGRLDGAAGARVHAQGRLHVRRAGDRARAWTSTRSRRASPSSSTPTSTSSRRSPSTARPGASGRASCATPTAPRTSARC